MKIANRFWIASSFLFLAVGIASVDAQTPAPSGGTESPPLDGPTLDSSSRSPRVNCGGRPVNRRLCRGSNANSSNLCPEGAASADRGAARRCSTRPKCTVGAGILGVGARRQHLCLGWRIMASSARRFFLGQFQVGARRGRVVSRSRFLEQSPRPWGGRDRIRNHDGAGLADNGATRRPSRRYARATPGPNYFFVPGHYEPNGDRLAWIPGFWGEFSSAGTGFPPVGSAEPTAGSSVKEVGPSILKPVAVGSAGGRQLVPMGFPCPQRRLNHPRRELGRARRQTGFRLSPGSYRIVTPSAISMSPTPMIYPR